MNKNKPMFGPVVLEISYDFSSTWQHLAIRACGEREAFNNIPNVTFVGK